MHSERFNIGYASGIFWLFLPIYSASPHVDWLVGNPKRGRISTVSSTMESWSACRSRKVEVIHTYDWPGAVTWGNISVTSAASGTSWSMAESALHRHPSTATSIIKLTRQPDLTITFIATVPSLVCAEAQVLVISSLLRTKLVWTWETVLGILAAMPTLAGSLLPPWL